MTLTVPDTMYSVANCNYASGKLLEYDVGGPLGSVQTAYGLEVEVGTIPDDPDLMVFMDHRDYMKQKVKRVDEECPSFLYAMSPTRVFFEEICLASENVVPFDQSKKKLTARLDTMGIILAKVHEEEWSYIPVGGFSTQHRSKDPCIW